MQIHLVFVSVITARGIPSTEYLHKSNRSGQVAVVTVAP